MNLKSPVLIIISLFSIINIALCQSPPGYLGKKTTIGFGVGIIAAIEGGPDAKKRGNLSPDDDLRDKLARDNLFNFELTRTVARNGSISLLFSKTATGVNSFFDVNLLTEDGMLDGRRARYDGFLKADVSSIGLMYNFFKGSKGHLAPFGSCFSIGFKRNRIKASYVPIDEETFTLGRLDIDPVFTNLSFVLGWSKTLILQDIIYIKPRLLFAANTKVSQITGTKIEDDQSDFEHDFHARVFLHEIIQIDISAGLLF